MTELRRRYDGIVAKLERCIEKNYIDAERAAQILSAFSKSIQSEARIEAMEQCQYAIRDHITELHNAEDRYAFTRSIQAEEGFRCIASINSLIQRERTDGDRR